MTLWQDSAAPDWTEGIAVLAGRVFPRVKSVGIALIFPFILLTAWWAAAHFVLLPATILPGPEIVFQTFLHLISDGELGHNLGASLWRVVQGFVLGSVLGLGLGLAMGLSPAVESWIGPTFRIFAQIPSLVWIPLLMLIFGIDDMLKLVVMAKACLIPVAFQTAAGIRAIPQSYREVGRVLRFSPRAYLLRIILPGALPAIFSGLRQGLAQVWTSLVIVEMLASTEGIGYLMAWGRLIFQLDMVMVCIVVVGTVGFLLDLTLKRIEARLMRWRDAHG